MRALVTGASGFIGANVVAALTQAGWEVRALLRPTSSTAALVGLAYEPVLGDVVDAESLPQAMAGCDAVFHVAGVVADYWRQDLEQLYRVNVEGTRNVVRAALATGMPGLVHTSSQVALGFGDGTRPVREDQSFDIPPKIYPYSHSKHLAELEVQRAVSQGLHAVIVNPTVVLGPRDVNLANSRIILEVQKARIPAVPAGGINVVDARDMAAGHLLALQRGRPGERYLLAGHNTPNLDLVAEIGAVLNVPPPRLGIPPNLIPLLAKLLDGGNRLSPRPLPLSGDVLRLGARTLYADNSKARQELGFRVTPLRETIQHTVAWLRDQGHLS